MSVLRSTAATATSILATVNTVANRTTQLVNTAASVTDMLDSFVQKTRTKQIASDQIEMHFYVERLKKSSALEQAKFEQDLIKELGNGDLNALYLEQLNKINTVLGHPVETNSETPKSA